MTQRHLSVYTLALIAILAFFARPSEAHAQVPDIFDINISAKGGVSFAGVDKPGKKEFEGRSFDVVYPGFFGVGQLYGFFIEPRFVGLQVIDLALEIGFIYNISQGSGDINDQTITLKANDLIIPIHAKIAIPLGLANFTIGLGADVWLPQSVEIDKPAGFNNIGVSDRESATYFGIQLGIEFKVPGLGLRIPLEFRGHYNPGLEDTFDPRITIPGPNAVNYIPTWEFQGELMLGVGYAINIL